MDPARPQPEPEPPTAPAVAWLRARMIEGWRLPQAQLLAEFAARPGSLALAQRLVWGVFEGASRHATHSFRLAPRGPGLEDLALLGLDGEPVELAPQQPLALLHPLELDRRTKRAWLEQLAAQGVEQPFAQLRRPVLRLTAAESRGELLRRLADRPIDLERLQHATSPWVVLEHSSLDPAHAGSIARVLRLRRGPVQMSAALLVDPTTRAARALFDVHGQELVHLHPVLLSELLCALERLTTLPHAALELELSELDARDGEDAEDAEDNVGACLGCGAQLHAGERVLGLWRPSITAQRRRARAHWTCIENLGELQLAAPTHDVRAELLALRSATDRPDARAAGSKQPAAGSKQLAAGSKHPAAGSKQEYEPAEPAARDDPAAAPLPSPLDEDEVLALCADQRSISAAKKTARLANWDDHGQAGELAWGACSGRLHYRVAVDLGRGLARCECSSRKRPCKHAVALMLLAARSKLARADAPDWARARFPDALEKF